MIYWITGQPGHGKTTIADAMLAEGKVDYIVDGDDLRVLMPNPGYDETGRRQNIDRAQAIAAYIDRIHKGNVAVALVAPYRDQRELFKAAHDVTEIYVHTTELRGRENFHSGDYEPPLENFIDIDTGDCTVEQAVRIIHREMAAVS